MVADALSRVTNIAAMLSQDINYSLLAADQASSHEISAYCIVIISLLLEDVHFQDFTVLCDTYTGNAQPILSVCLEQNEDSLLQLVPNMLPLSGFPKCNDMSRPLYFHAPHLNGALDLSTWTSSVNYPNLSP